VGRDAGRVVGVASLIFGGCPRALVSAAGAALSKNERDTQRVLLIGGSRVPAADGPAPRPTDRVRLWRKV
jgi:hypothetical protein